MQPKQLLLLFIVLLCIFDIGLTQKPFQLTLKETLHITVLPNKTQIYTLTIPEKIQEEKHLFIRLEPVIPDPLQQPYLVIKADNNY